MKTSISERVTAAAGELKALVDGPVIGRDDERYDSARSTFYGGFDRRPAAIVRVASAADVAQVVSYARDSGLELAVRSGGHSLVGHCVIEGGVVLDLSEMHAVEVDPDERTAWAGTGATAAHYTNTTGAFGLGTGFGDTGSVGIGGITLGGGVGYFVRKYGLTIDDLLAAEVVTADGLLLHTNEESEPDLFWAIRGGGGNFGVATRFRFRLHDISSLVGGMMMLPATPEIIARFIAEAQEAPEELSAIANVMVAPPMPMIPAELHGKLVLMALMAHVGPADAGERAVAPFRALATPLADMVKPMKVEDIYPPEQEDYHPVASGHTMFLDSVDVEVAGTILDRLMSTDAMMRVVQLRVLGGAMARVDRDATAFAHRKSRIMANIGAVYERVEQRPVYSDWVTSFADTLQQSDRGAYVNFLTDESEDRVRDAYPGRTWDRLRSIKRRYDPDNLFRSNQNIPPAHAD
jgi:FAD/FMN-containing dehydrogenase